MKPGWSIKPLVTILSTLLFMCTFAGMIEAAPPRISAPRYVLMDVDTGQILIEEASQTRAYPASTTKILTAYVVLSKTGLSNNISVPKEAKVGGSHIFLAPGDELSLDDAMYGLLLASANDAAVTLAHAVSGSVSAFSEEMNKAARLAGAVNSNFTNPHGLPDNDHYTTALDLALITRAALNNPAFERYVTTKQRDIFISGRRETVTNHNNMLWSYEGSTGVKTGFTQQSKHCLVSSAERDGRKLVAVVLGAPTSSAMWKDARTLLDYGFTAYKPLEVVKKGQASAEQNVERGKTPLSGVAAGSFSILGGESYPEVSVKATLDTALKAPIKAGTKVGAISITQSGRVLGQVDIVAENDVASVFWLPGSIYGIPAIMCISLLAWMISRRGQRNNRRRPGSPGRSGPSLDAERSSGFSRPAPRPSARTRPLRPPIDSSDDSSGSETGSGRRRRYQRKSWREYGSDL